MIRTRLPAALVTMLILTLPGAADDTLPSTATAFPHMPHEPSGVVALAPGLVLVVEDEKEHPFDLLRIGPGVSVSDERLIPATHLNDLEGVTRDARGRVYAITSHSPNKAGETKANRQRLARFRVTEEGITELQVLGNLRPRFERFPELRASLRPPARDGTLPPVAFEIEGLAWHPEKKALLMGLRGPVLDGKAVVLILANPGEAFEGAEPELRQARVDLSGQGIRGMEHDDLLGGFVIIGGNTSGPRRFDLWLWDGEGTTAKRLTVPAFETLQQPEGVCQVETGSSKRLLIVSDDGTTDKAYYKHPGRPDAINSSTPGSYLFIDYQALRAKGD